MRILLTFLVVTLLAFQVSAQNLVTGNHTGKYIRPPGNAVNFYFFNFMDYAAYTGAEKQINITADGNASHFRMPNVNYRVRLGIDAALGNARRRHGIGFSADFRGWGGDFIGGGQVSYAFQVVDKPNVQFRIGIIAGVEVLKRNPYDATYGDMIDDRFGFVYATSESLQNDSARFIYPRSAVGIWLRAHGFGLALNADRLIRTNLGPTKDFRPPVRFLGIAYYQIPVKVLYLMPSVSFLYYGSGYCVEGGLSLYLKPEKDFFTGVFASSNKDMRLLVGYNIRGKYKLLVGATLYFDGLAVILPVYDGFGSVNLNFVSYGR